MSFAHEIAYNDLRRALVALDHMEDWQLLALVSRLDVAMRRCPVDGPPAQEAEHNTLLAFRTYVVTTRAEQIGAQVPAA